MDSGKVQAEQSPSVPVPRIDPFQELTDRYESWFETYEAAYESEIEALRSLHPAGGRGLEIGVGTGRFAEPLDIAFGVDPAREMLETARDRGISVTRGVAEALPYRDDSFDSALIVTTICFVDDVDQTIREAARVLGPGGNLLLGYIDKESRVGRRYQEIKDENPFYRDARFVSTAELIRGLETIGFVDIEIRQTIFQMPEEMDGPDPVRGGFGDGSFVALRGTWPGDE